MPPPVPAALDQRSPVTAMLLGAVMISTTSTFVRLAEVAPTISAFYRMLLGGLMLLFLLRAVGAPWRPRWAVLWALSLPAAAFAIDLMLWHRSILIVGPGLATLLGNLQVFFMALAGWLLYRERLSPRFMAGVLLAFAGLWLLVGRSWQDLGGDYRFGVWLGVATALAYAVYMLSFRGIQRRVGAASPMYLLCWCSLLCALMLGGAGLAEGQSFAIPDLRSGLALLGLALFGQVLGWLLISQAMPRLDASMVGLLLLLQPLLAFGMDVVLFARPTDALDWVGVAVSALGIFIGSMRATRSDKAGHST
ncbi:MAG: DMT family transporter [Aquimonas sp.]|nr:DMT family transporter [Aquimonas sp.]